VQSVKDDLFDNGFGGKPINPAYDGGIYEAYPPLNTGGGGGGYTPPVEPNPTFVPPVYTQNDLGSLKINLIASEAVEFLENDINVGIGGTQTLVYTPSLTFGNSKTYKANLANKISTNYFIVNVEKKYQPIQNIEPLKVNFDLNINPYSSIFGGMGGNTGFSGLSTFNNTNTLYNWNYNYTPTLTRNEQLYTEVININEYNLNSDGDWVVTPRSLDSTSGTISLEFKFKSNVKAADVTPIEIIDSNVSYEIGFTTNLNGELNDYLKLSYEIFDESGNILDKDLINLSAGNTDNKKLKKSVLEKSSVRVKIIGNLPTQYTYKNVYYANIDVAKNTINSDFSKWNNSNTEFTISGKELGNGIYLTAIFEKEIQVAKPQINLLQTKYDVQIKDSDTEKPVYIQFTTSNADNVLVYISEDVVIKVPASDKQVTLYFQKDFKEIYGTKKIAVIPVSDLYGTGDKSEVLVTFTAINDFPSITEIIFADSIDVPSFSDLNIDYEVIYNSFAVSSIDVFLLLKDKTRVGLFQNLTPNGSFKINLKDLANRFSQWNGNDNVTLIFKPYNRSGVEELIGNEYSITTTISYPSIKLDEDTIKKSVYDAFVDVLTFIEPEYESKHLTHLVNFGDNEQIIVSSWDYDNWTLSEKGEDELGNVVVTKKVESIILKLYSPLPANITSNSTLWVTKLMSNPLIETVILNDQADLHCPPLKGPNFNIETDFVSGKSTNYESLDNLILSGSTSTTELVSTYLSSSIINTDELNIQYVSGSNLSNGKIIWDNFVHFSSAKERVDNFVYKVKLIELYESLIEETYDTGLYNTSAHTASLSAQQERDRQSVKKNEILKGFDGFEKFLYVSSSYTSNSANSFTWPYNGNIRLSSTSTTLSNWYDNIITLAEDFDIENSNWIQNNIPQYISSNTENDSLLLFFSMIGHHFDSIYYHTKSIEKSRGLGYQSKNGISDKLLFDTLKSFNWDAKNLAASETLWNYTFGLDSNGNTKELNPAKQRTAEVWRRIINNLPYLLKHKGTRRGIYAIMACYGIPSSNLSILEFGGPEVTETTKSKLVMDNITTALKLTTNSYLKIGWNETDKNRKSDTIEFFVKLESPMSSSLVSGSGWSIGVESSSVSSSYGKVVFNYSGANAISSSLVPIFNGNFFGIEAIRTTGSVNDIFELNIRQADKERTIFQNSVSKSVNINTARIFNSGSFIEIGRFSGSIDEFRLWSVPLDRDRFFEHVSFPEMVNGNTISSSTEDLYFRLDFEYPKNLNATSSLINVDTNIYFNNGINRNQLENGSVSIISGSTILSDTPNATYSASAYFPTSIPTYPYQFEVIDRSVMLEIPDMGASRYSTNKVRFESQELVSSLSSKTRSTKKAFDQSPTDSNRVGLFFSPTKELNIDIAKSMGGLNLDNYIGDPSDSYKPNYSRLDSLREYYFQRFDGRDIYSYINLIKLYEKSMFEDIKKMLPARVKATTGLLIEPHILERSKVTQKKPSGDEYQQETTISYGDTTILTSENNQYDALINNGILEHLIGENNQYETTIYSSSINNITAENNQYDSLIGTSDSLLVESEYYQKEVNIDAGLGESTILTEIDLINSNTIVGQTDYENIGFGIYAESGSAIRTYFDLDGSVKKERIRVNLVTEQKTREIVKYKTSINGVGDPRDGMILTSSVYTETSLNIQPFSGSTPPIVKGNIISVKAVSGYLPTHYRNTSDLTTGMINSYYKGSKNTAATTLDGSSPIETFVSNPNTLTVNRTGRGTSEPILEVE